ncbi:MAG TPA: hypothetical protein VF532_05815 [Candidatus Angelobacter sp.]
MIHSAKLVGYIELPHALVFRYRCCDDPRTDSTFTFNDPHLVSDADRNRLLAIHAANIESRHEAKLAIEKHLAAHAAAHAQHPASRPQITVAGATHECTIAGVEHVADEIVRVRYSCCGAGPELHHSEQIDHIQRHTPDEVDSFCQAHMQEAARRCAIRAAAAKVRRELPAELRGSLAP